MATDLPGAHVTRAGPSAVHELGGFTLRKASVSAEDNNCYLITSADGAQLLVDAADDAERVLGLVREGGGQLTAVVTTHRHRDHHRALPDVAAATGARVLAGGPDAAELPVAVDRGLADGDTVVVGDTLVEVIALRGHTPGSVALALPERGGDHDGRVHLLTGDSLFPGGPGRTWSAADFTSLVDDLEARIFDRFGDDTRVYPGHGDDTTLGRERPHLARWRARGW